MNNPKNHAEPSVSNRQLSTLGIISQFDSPKLMLGKTPHLAITTKAEIRTAALDLDFANQHAAAIPDVDPVSTPGVYIPEHVAFDPVRGSRIRVGKHPPVGEKGLLVLPKDRVCINRGGAAEVFGAVAVDEVGVGDVDDVFDGGEAYAVGTAKPVRYDPNVACGGIEAVHQLRELRFRPKALLIAINRVRKPNGAVRMHDDVIGRIERAGVVIIQDGGGFVRTLGFHVDESRGLLQWALGAENQAIAVIRPPVGHVVAFRTSDFITGKVGRGKELDFGDDDGFVAGRHRVRRRVGKLVRRDKEGICRGMEHTGFVEIWRARVVDQKLEGGRGAQQGQERVVIDQEGLWLRGSGRCRGRSMRC